jgi:pyruvate,water dikinase
MQALNFKDVYYGIPEPAEEAEVPVPDDGSYRGLPVSMGKIEGKVKIINSLDDARRLEAGDIMIASYTDVGWTPYFSIIGGLVTEIGSALSHGAVVAREYGIPAVVSVRGAKKAFKDGDMVILDGDKGTIRKI